MFIDKWLLADVDFELDIKTNAVLDFCSDYLKILKMNGLVCIYNDLKDEWLVFFHLYRRIKKEDFNKQAITKFLKTRISLSN